MKTRSNKVMEEGYLYIIENEGWIKVGKTSQPKKRLTSYNNSFSEDKLKYYYLSEKLYDYNISEELLLEYLEGRFGVIRRRREWFKSTTNNSNIHLKAQVVKKIEEIIDSYML